MGMIVDVDKDIDDESGGSLGGFGVVVHSQPGLDLFLIGVGLLELVADFLEQSFVDVEENVVVCWLLFQE